MPPAPLELRSTPERKVVMVRSPETVPASAIPVFSLVIAALLRVDTSMLRPPAAVSVSSPVLALAKALTPVLAVRALMAAAVCAPRSALEAAAARAPMLAPLTQMSLLAIAPMGVVTGAPEPSTIVPVAAIDKVVEKVIEKNSGESNFRKAVREGMPPSEAFAKFGVL